MFLDLIVFLFYNKKVVLMKTGGNVGVNVDQQLEQKFIPCE